MKVLKFGGTSVGTPERMKALSKLIGNDEPKIVVLSAMSGTTNHLVEVARYLEQKNIKEAKNCVNHLEDNYKRVVEELYHTANYKDLAKKKLEEVFATLYALCEVDFSIRNERVILAQGELMSTMLLNYYLNESGVDSALLPALNFMRKDLQEEPDMFFVSEILKRELAQYPDCKLFITQGFICRNYKGEIDNLKRGGSDYSASIIGAAIGAEEVQIWTDIDGFHNNDPRVVDKTHAIPKLSFDEAAELAYFGAKILHPTCVIPVQEANIPLLIKNTMEPDAVGTRISNETEGEGIIKAVAAKDHITAVKIKSGRMMLAYGFLRKIFDVFEEYQTSIDMITTSEVAISLTIDDTKNLQQIVGKLVGFGSIEVDEEMTIVSVVGSCISESNDASARIFNALANIPIRMISFGGSRHNISLLVKSEDKKAALEALNTLFS